MEKKVPEVDSAEKGLYQNIGRATMVLTALAANSAEGMRLTDVVNATSLGLSLIHISEPTRRAAAMSGV